MTRTSKKIITRQSKDFEKPKIIAFVLAFKEKPFLPIYSLSNQTLKVDKIVIVAAYPSACMEKFDILCKTECVVIAPNEMLSIGERVGVSLTLAFKKFDISKYDYMLKLDSDISFDEKFIEENIKGHYDLMGRGAGMIIKTDEFLKIFGHQWPISSIDDVYIVEAFRVKGCKLLAWKWIHPAKLLKEPNYSFKRVFRIGMEIYKLGIPFIDEIFILIYWFLKKRKIMFIAHPFGYITAYLKKERKYPISHEVERYHKSRLINKIRVKILHKKIKVGMRHEYLSDHSFYQ